MKINLNRKSIKTKYNYFFSLLNTTTDIKLQATDKFIIIISENYKNSIFIGKL